MTDPLLDRLVVTADLHVDVDGVRAHVRGDGDHLVVATDHPYRLARQILPALRLVGSGTARRGLHQLTARGLTVTLAGPRRDLVRAGADAGRRHLQLTRPPVRSRAAVTGGLAAVLAVAVLRHRRP